MIPASGAYFVGVTTFDNNPILDANGIGTAWEDDGESNVVFDLFVSRVPAIPEPSAITLFVIGATSLLSCGWLQRNSAGCLASAGNGETPHPSYTTTRQESRHAKAPQELYACREGRHPSAPPDRPRPRL